MPDRFTAVPGGHLPDPRRWSKIQGEEVLELLDRWRSSVRPCSVADVTGPPGARALVVGDTHSDWPTLDLLARQALLPPGSSDVLIATGDYVDRAPRSFPTGPP